MYLRNLGPTFAFFDQSKNCPALGLVYCSAVAIVIVPDNHDVEDVAGDVTAQVGVCTPHRLHLRLGACRVRRRRHKGILIIAAREVLQTATDPDRPALPRFVGIGEVHLLFRQERAQVFVDLLQRRVFE